MANITYAGYGVWNSTVDVTQVIKQQYTGGITKFVASNTLVSDPAPGERKYLYAVWKSGSASYSAVVGENDGRGISLSPAPASPSDILYAGYGVWNSTQDVTSRMQQLAARKETTFTASNNWVTGDPAAGERKYLYIVWNENGITNSGVVGESDDRGVTLPAPAVKPTIEIAYAGYGVWNQTYDVTTAFKQRYDQGMRKFTADNSYGGDPSPGNRKYLFAIWKIGGVSFSAVVGEDDSRGLMLP